MDSPKTGIDLERELTCSICTELLYQPLTLLDCLHTFCGSCLKEWFTFQAATIEKAPSPPSPDNAVLTCPSCRSPVRDTRHSATVVSLLEMFVAANPVKARSEEEKADMASKYKPGDQILPKINIRERTAEERRDAEEDRRLIDEVREMSLRESSHAPALPPRPRAHRDSRSADSRSRSSGDPSSSEGRSHRTRDGGHRPRREERRSSDHLTAEDERSHRRRRRAESRQRRVEHQSSLRSLIGSDGMSERDIEREIEEFARQIQEEGLLDGLDLDNIDLTQDDELSRRITEAYRRRQRGRSRHEPARRSNASAQSASSRHTEANQTEPRRPSTDSRTRTGSRPGTHVRSRSATGRAEDRTRPPPSMSATLDVREHGRTSRRRTGSTGRTTTLPGTSSSADQSPASRSQTDLTLRTQTLDSATSRPDFTEGRSSSTPTVSSRVSPPAPVELPGSTTTVNPLSFASRVPQPNSTSGERSKTPPELAGTIVTRAPRPAELAVVHSAVSSPVAMSPTAAGHQRKRSQLYPEPSITCSRCSKPHIEYELHYNCRQCSNGQWNICLDCYRAGKGCQYWFGFGYGAWAKWEKARQQGDGSLAKPHMLDALRYLPPPSTPGGADGRRTLTTDDPKHRLESGTFCARCFAWTNACYWRCDACNEGDWGFCNNCVNQGKSCTHMLLPLTHESSQTVEGRPASPRSPGRPPAAAVFTGPSASNIGPFKPLVFNTRCDICHNKISPSQPRYHCLSCTSSLVSDGTPGDYDICIPCYNDLVNRGKLSYENGHSGWRRCLNGHRMTIIGFAEGKIGQWRYVDRDLVGGRVLRAEPHEGGEHAGRGLQKWSWTQDGQRLERLVTKDVAAIAPASDGGVSFTHNFPPDGGVGSRAVARWSWYPKESSDDELLFPRGAEVKEIEDVNGDWFFGVYMGTKGLFPSPYVRVQPTS